VCVVSLILWFSLFFPLLFPQIEVNTVYGNANCTILSATKVPYLCCYKTCSVCSSCYWTDPSCSSLLATNSPGPCCDGYECCNQCCQECTSCSGSGSSRSCTTYSCNCYCCDSVANLACNVYCPTCWQVVVQAEYTCKGNSQCCVGIQPATFVKDCGQDQSCADQFLLEPFLQYNTTSTCYYNPNQCDEIAFTKGYTWWYWLIWAFPTFALLFLLNFWTFVGLNTKFDNWRLAFVIYLFIWWVILFPLVIMLPIALATTPDQISPDAQTGILATAFSIMGISLGIIGYLLYTNYGCRWCCGSTNELLSEQLTSPPPLYT